MSWLGEAALRFFEVAPGVGDLRVVLVVLFQRRLGLRELDLRFVERGLDRLLHAGVALDLVAPGGCHVLDQAVAPEDGSEHSIVLVSKF